MAISKIESQPSPVEDNIDPNYVQEEYSHNVPVETLSDVSVIPMC